MMLSYIYTLCRVDKYDFIIHINKLYVIMKEEIQTEKLVQKFNIEKESLTEESILKDFQEDIKNLPNEYRS